MKIDAQNISVVFNNRYLIKQKNFNLNHGKSVLLKGDNGTGKTTLIKVLAGVKSIDGGCISYFDGQQSISKSLFQKNLGLCLGSRFLCLDLTLKENLSLYHNDPKANLLIKKMLEDFLLHNKLNQVLKTFSKGELQKASLCRAMLYDPETLFLDEPFEGLDQKSQQFLKQYLTEQKNKKTILLCTHNNIMPDSFFDEVWEMDS